MIHGFLEKVVAPTIGTQFTMHRWLKVPHWGCPDSVTRDACKISFVNSINPVFGHL
ncbi:hypothetical protein AKO1_002643 [Acrasis kona]|uniref:Uncharacterized protein n=1 Tax=Acrasis kona TaxID=1008807 RepID=A0AAW2ZM94_9EUKA